MCDNKYVITNEGQKLITDLLENKITNSESQAVDKIINSMSYSKVKAKGFPDLGKYQQAYHVVREADLLCAYDFDRCILYHLYKKNTNIESAYDESVELFMNRMLQHEKDNLFTYEYTKQQANVLKFQSLNRIKQWKKIIKSFKRIIFDFFFSSFESHVFVFVSFSYHQDNPYIYLLHFQEYYVFSFLLQIHLFHLVFPLFFE